MRLTPCLVGCCTLVALTSLGARGQALASRDTLPRVTIPTGAAVVTPRPTDALRSAQPAPRSLFPWKLGIPLTVFWIGEQPTANNPVPNRQSSWDSEWQHNYGGYDDPDPANRIADRTTGDFRPKAFTPKLKPVLHRAALQ